MKNVQKIWGETSKKIAKHLHKAGFKNEEICAACEFKGSDACAVVNDGACVEGIHGWLESEAGV